MFITILGWEQPAGHRMDMSVRVLYPPSSEDHVLKYYELIWNILHSNYKNYAMFSVITAQTN